MAQKLRIVLAQLNLEVGDIQGNAQKHLQAAAAARDNLSADLIVFPELSLTGYPPEDLLLRPAFIQDTEKALKKLTEEIQNIYCLICHPHATDKGLYNACSLIYNGNIVAQYFKQHLPNYGVFDEARYFKRGDEVCIVNIKGIPTALTICEDAWFTNPIQKAKNAGAQLIISPNASPFEIDKHDSRVKVLRNRIKETQLPIVYVNNVGGQDELVFDGGSMVINDKGNITHFAGFFNETLLAVDMEFSDRTIIQPAKISPQFLSPIEKIYQALVLAVRDYINKNHFPGVLIGLSGGIDSALTLAIAVDALGNDRVHAVYMPSRYSADISFEDAKKIAETLQVKFEIISIEEPYKSFLTILTPSFADKKPDVTEENIQARCRAVILMALSNKTNYLVLPTSNRSELAVGYCTLYGDMAGGFAPLKDVYKTMVYELAKYRNAQKPIIPQRTIERAPTAELAPNQKDEDTLPPYSVLDKILYLYLNQTQSMEDIIQAGFSADLVKKTIRLIYKSEYKRRQSAIGPRIDYTSFGKDWRYPVTDGFKG